jgi:hypothetical protein
MREENHGFVSNPRLGAKNLLENCVKIESGQSVVIVAEDLDLGFYDAQAVECIIETAQSMGCVTRQIACPLTAGPGDIPEAVMSAMGEADHVIFQARAGDRIRFTDLSGKATKTIIYAFDVGLLGSSYATIHHGLMQEILDSFETHLDTVQRWRITCPLGTDVSGTQEPASGTGTQFGGDGDNFTLGLFPIPIFRPVSCGSMNGRVVLARWLMPSANRVYPDDILLIDEPVTAFVENGKITGYEGPSAVVGRIKEHCRRVGDLFGIKEKVVHSWHTGIHPGAHSPFKASSNIERWGSVAFANPRYTHFHTCGDFAPGEITWSVLDATIELDDKTYWRGGEFMFLKDKNIKDLPRKYGLDSSILKQRMDIGI